MRWLFRESRSPQFLLLDGERRTETHEEQVCPTTVAATLSASKSRGGTGPDSSRTFASLDPGLLRFGSSARYIHIRAPLSCLCALRTRPPLYNANAMTTTTPEDEKTMVASTPSTTEFEADKTHIAESEYPDGGLRAWLVVAGELSAADLG